MLALILVAACLSGTLQDDVVTQVPGYPRNYSTDVYAGYLGTSSKLRRLHYVFVVSKGGSSNADPLTLWMNGGPGCSSKLGFIQEIAPYFLDLNQPYYDGLNLTFNAYSWHNLSNLLFLDSPAGVGFSINSDPDFKYNDSSAAQDALDALVDFFTMKQPTYAGRPFYIAGESYAGKYIPDLANLIYRYGVDNPDSPFNLKGILVGNGVMTFEGGSLERSEIDYMVERDFIDPELAHYWVQSCQQDEESAGCQFFYSRFEDLVGDINPYNVYGYCYPDVTSAAGPAPSQRLLMKMAARVRTRPSYGDGDCEYDFGLETYFNNNSDRWHSNSTVPFAACNATIFENFERTPTGSMDAYVEILRRGLKVWMFNGDWDDVVPFRDTLKNLRKLGLEPTGDYTPWIIDGQHAGFLQEYPGLMFYLVKGAGHEVPQYQRQRAFELFKAFLKA